MNTIFIILFAQFISVMTCAALHLMFYLNKQDFPLHIYRIMAGMVFFGTVLALTVVLPVLKLFGWG